MLFSIYKYMFMSYILFTFACLGLVSYVFLYVCTFILSIPIFCHKNCVNFLGLLQQSKNLCFIFLLLWSLETPDKVLRQLISSVAFLPWLIAWGGLCLHLVFPLCMSNIFLEEHQFLCICTQHFSLILP